MNTYKIKNESGEEFEVKFPSKRHLENWIEMERNLFNKNYVIVG